MKYIKYAPYIVIILMAGALYWQDRGRQEIYNQYNELQARHSELIEEADGIYSRFIGVEGTIAILKNDTALYKYEISRLLKVVQGKNERIRALQAFTAYYEPDTVTIAIPDTVKIPAGVPSFSYEFERELPAFDLYGRLSYFPPSSPVVRIRFKHKPIDFSVALVELESGGYKTYVQTSNKFLKIGNVEGKVIRRDETFLERIQYTPYIDIGYFKQRGATVSAGIILSRARISMQAFEDGLDYGGQFAVWKKTL